MWLVHNYLFVKIPLLRPDRRRLTSKLRGLLPAEGLFITYGLGIYGVFSLFWEWESHHAIDYFSHSKAVYFGLAMVAVKIAHELGHAIVAKHHGLRVSSMGVALLVYFLSYTRITLMHGV